MQQLSDYNQQAISILERMGEAFLAVDSSANIIYINMRATKLLNIDKKKVLGKEIWQGLDFLDETLFQNRYHQAVSTSSNVFFEVYFEHLSSWFEVRLYPSSEGVAIYFTNINTEKQLAAERAKLISELETANSLLDTLFAQAPVGFGVWDRELRFVRVNQTLAEMNGFTPQEHIGKTIKELLPKVDSSVTKAFQKVLKTGKPVLHQEASGQTPAQPNHQRYWSVSYYPVRYQSEIVGVGGVCIEITEQKNQEQERKKLLHQLRAERDALQTSEENFKLLANAMPQMVWIADDAGCVEYFNERWYNYTGLSEQQSVGLGWTEALHPDDLQYTMELWTEAVTNQEPFQIEYRFRRKNHTQYEWHLGRAVPILDKQGEVVKWYGTSTNIDNQKRLDEKKDEFIGIASHELKTPLTSVKGYVQILERIIHEMGDEKARLYLNRTNTYINRLDSLIIDLLDVSKIQAGKIDFNITEFNLSGLIEETVEVIQPTISSHQLIVTKQEPVQVRADRERLEQVLTNLITNAIKYSPEGKNVVIATRQIDSSTVQVSVTDQGIGIPKNKRTRIFERFYRVDESSKKFSGLGIGLFISSEIIKRLGGRMWVESEVNQGSTFHFTLPIVE